MRDDLPWRSCSSEYRPAWKEEELWWQSAALWCVCMCAGNACPATGSLASWHSEWVPARSTPDSEGRAEHLWALPHRNLQRGWGCLGHPNQRAAQNLGFNKKPFRHILYQRKQDTRKSGNPIVYLEVWKEIGQWFVSIVTIIEIRPTDTNTDLLSYSSPLKDHFHLSWFLNINKKSTLPFTIIIFSTCKWDFLK